MPSLANIYMPSLGNKKNTFYSELYAIHHFGPDFQFLFLFILKKYLKKCRKKNLSKCLTIYIIIIN